MEFTFIIVIFLIGLSIGKITTEQIDYYSALIMIIASLIAAPLG